MCLDLLRLDSFNAEELRRNKSLCTIRDLENIARLKSEAKSAGYNRPPDLCADNFYVSKSGHDYWMWFMNDRIYFLKC